MHLLATLLVDAGRREEALALWIRAFELGLKDPVAFRNAAVMSYNVSGNSERARDWYRLAIELSPRDARLWYESDQLEAREEASDLVRLARLRPVEEVILERDDATIEYCDLLTATGEPDKAHEIMTERRFAPWEGGEGRILAAWENACIGLAFATGDDAVARALLDDAEQPPSNLGEARHPLTSTDRIESARALLAADGIEDDERIKLLELGRVHPSRTGRAEEVDYFATSLPELLLFDFQPVDTGVSAP
jgi:hypothetical protein